MDTFCPRPVYFSYLRQGVYYCGWFANVDIFGPALRCPHWGNSTVLVYEYTWMFTFRAIYGTADAERVFDAEDLDSEGCPSDEAIMEIMAFEANQVEGEGK